MARTLNEYLTVLKYAKHLGCSKFIYHGMIAEFEPKLPLSQALDSVKVGEELNPTEDQLLYWSTDYEPNITASSPEE